MPIRHSGAGQAQSPLSFGAMPNCIEQADLRRFQAKMYLDRDEAGDGDRAGRLLEEAVAEYKRMGMPKHVEIARGMLSEAK